MMMEILILFILSLEKYYNERVEGGIMGEKMGELILSKGQGPPLG